MFGVRGFDDGGGWLLIHATEIAIRGASRGLFDTIFTRPSIEPPGG
jgi:hypothetical protein